MATLVARESPPAEVFTKVAEEVGLLLGAESAWMHFYEPDGSGTVVGTWGELGTAFPLGTRLTLEGERVTALVRQTRRPARIDDYTKVSGSVGTYASELGIRSAVAGPIVVEGRLWGAMVAATRGAEPCRRARSRASESSPSWSRPQSRTSRRARSSPPRVPGSWRPPTMNGGGWSATCTTERSSRWCTPS